MIKLKLLILLFLVSLSTSFAGIDEMNNRRADEPPTEAPGNGNGGGQDNNPNVPLDNGILIGLLILGVTGVGVYQLRKKNEPTGTN